MSELFISLKGNDREKVLSVMKEMSISMNRAEAERDHMKAMIDRLKEDFDIPPKYARKAAKAYHAQMFIQMQVENETFEDFYEDLFGKADDSRHDERPASEE